jgi:predicted dehydrogenase
MSTKQCRWGILGAATIARKNWQSIRDAGNATLVAVASRDAQRSAQFVAECQRKVPFPQPPAALGSYEELIARPDIDAIYLPLPTGLRKDWAIRAANAGKHVMVEKPVGATVADAEAILAACERNRVQFMDGVMFNHSRRLAEMRQVLDDGKSVGEIRRIATSSVSSGTTTFSAATSAWIPIWNRSVASGISDGTVCDFHSGRCATRCPGAQAAAFIPRPGRPASRTEYRRNSPASCFTMTASPPRFTARFSRRMSNGPW